MGFLVWLFWVFRVGCGLWLDGLCWVLCLDLISLLGLGWGFVAEIGGLWVCVGF